MLRALPRWYVEPAISLPPVEDKLVSIGEFLIGVALILGVFTGLTAFLGGFLNWSYMMAGSGVSVIPCFWLSLCS
jgi:uncharacterized membrane protein YphA (DoxX/SURF4 family)